MPNTKDAKIIDLYIPLLPEMVKIARLSVSGLASNMGFMINDIEDIKVVVSEVCNILIKNKTLDKVHLKFTVKNGKLAISFYFVNGRPEKFVLIKDEDDDFAFQILNALVDDAQILKEGDKIISLNIFIREN